MKKKLYDNLVKREGTFDDAGFFFTFNSNMTYMKKVYRELYDKTGEIILRGKYNYAASVIICLDDNSRDNILPLYKKALVDIGFNIEEVFISYYKKCSKDDLNDYAFDKEAQLYEDSTFLLHGNFDEIPFSMGGYKNIDYDKLINMDEVDAVKELSLMLSGYLCS